MKSIYKSKQSENAILELYNRQLKALNTEYEDIFVDTRFGKTHVVKIGNKNGKPLLVTHGGNFTMPYELSYYAALLPYFCVYAVDTIGHPGKSSQTVVSHKTMEYGEWASDVITGLGFQKISCLSGSIGCRIILKLMCVAPEKVEKAVLIVPAGFANTDAQSLGKSVGLLPAILYPITGKEKWLRRILLPMVIEEKNITDALIEMHQYSRKHVAAKNNVMSGIANAENLQRYTAPTFIIVSEYDAMFPCDTTLANAKEMIKNLKTHVLKGQRHKFVLPDDAISMIKEFLESDCA